MYLADSPGFSLDIILSALLVCDNISGLVKYQYNCIKKSILNVRFKIPTEYFKTLFVRVYDLSGSCRSIFFNPFSGFEETIENPDNVFRGQDYKPD